MTSTNTGSKHFSKVIFVKNIGECQFTNDQNRVDINFVVRMLQASYWASDRSRELISKTIKNSLCFSVFCNDEQIGFARVVTDSCIFAWLADVVIDPQHQGYGLGKQLVEYVLNHSEVESSSQQLLQTRDAHTLYERFGFVRSELMSRYAE